MSNDRHGFSLVELLVVSVLGSLLLMATYQILITNQQTYRENADQVRSQQNIRMGLDIMAAELREVKPEDLTLLQDYGVSFDAPTNFGIVCGIDEGPPVVLTVMKYGDWFGESADVRVFADNNPNLTGDDVWIPASVTARDTTGMTCGTEPAQELTFTGQEDLFEADTVRSGAPVRALEARRYARGGSPAYLRRSEAGTSSQIAGPIASNGLVLRYLDESGTPTSTPANVRRIEISITDGTTSLSTTVFPRN